MLGMMWWAIKTNITSKIKTLNLLKVFVDLKRTREAIKNGRRIKK